MLECCIDNVLRKSLAAVLLDYYVPKPKQTMRKIKLLSIDKGTIGGGGHRLNLGYPWTNNKLNQSQDGLRPSEMRMVESTPPETTLTHNCSLRIVYTK